MCISECYITSNGARLFDINKAYRGKKKLFWGAKNPIRILAGQYYDQETGLHYNYHRYYDPQTGRYLRPDPIGIFGGINLYRYASNNPINRIDPLGLFTFGIDFSSTAGAGVGGTSGVTAGIASDGTVGIVPHVGGGGYANVGGSVDLQLQITNASSMYDLGGYSVGSGGSFLFFTNELIIMDSGNYGYNFGISLLGADLSPITVHSMFEHGFAIVFDPYQCMEDNLDSYERAYEGFVGLPYDMP